MDFLSAVCTESAIGISSYNNIAAHIGADSGSCVSRQALWKKATTPCEDFFKKILALVITGKINTVFVETLKTQSKYKRILVQDSTIIRLPAALFSEFSGVANGQTKVCNAHVQCVYDLLSEQFVSFSIDPYSINDLTAAPEIILEANDLVLRDRGYLILDEIQRHLDNNAHCIYRYKFNMVLKDQLTEEQIDLFSILKKEKSLDIKIMLNNKAKTIVRLLAYPVSKEVADKRRMKAKNAPQKKT
ncbi:MAG: transposase [Lutibacter sp.]|nr:transposase [Lutibacter sp.]